MTEWNKEEIYDAEISPLMVQIIAVCKRENIPMLACFQYAHAEDEEGDAFCTTHIPGVDEATSLQRARAEILDTRKPLYLTVRDADGKIKSMEAIL